MTLLDCLQSAIKLEVAATMEAAMVVVVVVVVVVMVEQIQLMASTKPSCSS
jgi:hypothetical protein